MQNLSSLAKGSLAMSSSMGAGNTVSDPPKFGSPGIPSEATSDMPWNPQFNDPEPQIGEPSREHTDTRVVAAGSFTPTPRTWKECP